MSRSVRVESTGASGPTSLRFAVGRFIDWLQRFGAFSQDPHDFWAWNPGRRAKSLYYRHPIVGTLAVSPMVIADAFLPASRRLVRAPQRFPISDANYAMGFLELWRAEHDPRWLQTAQDFLAALLRTQGAGSDGAWGLPFDWESNAITYPAGLPLITMTPYAYEALDTGFDATGEASFLTAMESAARFAFSLSEVEVAPGISAASYSPIDHRKVVNANAYRAFILTAAGERFNRPEWCEAATRNIRFVLRSQLPDGSWPYATDGRDVFIDNIHTCFVLKNLIKARGLNAQPDSTDAIRNGYDFYKRSLLDAGRLPVPFARKPRLTLYRRELYDLAEGINLALLMRDLDSEAEAIQERLVTELVDHWMLPDGHFITRQMVIGTNRVPYHRWGQAQAFRALVLSCAGRS